LSQQTNKHKKIYIKKKKEGIEKRVEREGNAKKTKKRNNRNRQ